MSKLSDNSNSGPDDVPSYFLKRCWSILEQPILHLFNKSLETVHNVGKFPSAWKFSYILQIYNSGDRGDFRDYRPNSIIGTVAKIFDAIVSNAL